MHIRNIARLSTVTLACLSAAAVALPAVSAAPAPAPHPQSAKAGSSSFTADSFTTNPAPAVRSRVTGNALKALAAHKAGSHTATGDNFTVRNMVVDRDGSADVRFDRTYHGLKVYGGDVIVHLAKNGAYQSLATGTKASGAVSTTPKVAASRATAVSRAAFSGHITAVTAPKLAIQAHLDGTSTLVWETVLHGVRADQTPSILHVLTDAQTGKVLSTHDDVDTFAAASSVRAAQAAPKAELGVTPLVAGNGRSIYSGSVSIDLTQSGTTFSMRDPSHGNGFTTNLNHATAGTGTVFSNTTGNFGNGANSDPASAAVDAHYGAAKTFDYYKSVHGRNGIFGDGRGVASRTHYGQAFVNAFWDGTQMTYGDGQGNARPLVELDVAGHEMSHGVSGALTGWAENGETGGMNEGTSDIFGTMVEFFANNPVDPPDYTLGELINISGNNRPLRWMYQPSIDGQSPDCWNNANGGLDPHFSMGPLNHWFYLTAVGSGNHATGNSPTCNNSTVTGLGNDKASKIWFRALASYANSNENYHQARIDSLKAAADLYGAHCTEYNTVNAAWAAVSVTGADPVPGNCNSQPGGPSVTSPGDQTSAVGSAVSVQIHATDPAGKTISYSATGLPAGLSINATSGLISGTPTTAGTSSVTVTAKNSDNAAGAVTFNWTVNGGGNPGDCGTLQPWSATTAYVPNDQVSFNGHKWLSTWFSTGAVPDDPQSWAVWSDQGAC